MSHQLSSDAYTTSNVSETTLVDASKPTTSLQPAQKPSFKDKVKMKLAGSVDPTKKPADPIKSWEARAGK
ncbi:hypothetical protein FALBO_7877 [Fusarium albosuccineum]|uniref:Uncharacterized protein n=2 Tax=Fusarium decemcellulare species complex TaxID=1329916 RepID=A0A8H4L9B6_9HYPO|nr:hypothetical protein FALBO_7877 [Fusarium albosuccineum]KAF5002162.1 hypothetical protein FDECE_10707 [Fusarium decemcellulare]KAJ3518675.1 hypothetical protein NM208_g14431 [Fusarium decemcellulare]